MQPEPWSVNRIAVETGVDRRTVAKRLSAAGVRPVETRGRSKLYRVREAFEVVLTDNKEDRADRATRELALRILPAMFESGLPWKRDDLTTLDVYASENGMSIQQVMCEVDIGLPILPPEGGDADMSGPVRISRGMAERWRILFSGLVQELGGNGLAADLADESVQILLRSA